MSSPSNFLMTGISNVAAGGRWATARQLMGVAWEEDRGGTGRTRARRKRREGPYLPSNKRSSCSCLNMCNKKSACEVISMSASRLRDHPFIIIRNSRNNTFFFFDSTRNNTLHVAKKIKGTDKLKVTRKWYLVKMLLLHYETNNEVWFRNQQKWNKKISSLAT